MKEHSGAMHASSGKPKQRRVLPPLSILWNVLAVFVCYVILSHIWQSTWPQGMLKSRPSSVTANEQVEGDLVWKVVSLYLIRFLSLEAPSHNVCDRCLAAR